MGKQKLKNLLGFLILLFFAVLFIMPVAVVLMNSFFCNINSIL